MPLLSFKETLKMGDLPALPHMTPKINLDTDWKDLLETDLRFIQLHLKIGVKI